MCDVMLLKQLAYVMRYCWNIKQTCSPYLTTRPTVRLELRQIDFWFFECDWMCPYLESIVWEFFVFLGLLNLLIIINNPSTKHLSKKQTKGKKHPVNRKQRKMVKLAYILVFIFGTADRTYGSNPDCMDYKIQVSDNYKISL